MSTLLDWVLATNPSPLQASLDASNPFSAQLMVMGTNSSGADVTLQGVAIELLIGADGDQLTPDAPTSAVSPGWLLCDTQKAPGSVTLVFHPGDNCDDPQASATIHDQQSIVFTINDVAMNEKPGTTTVTVTEGSPGNPTQPLSVSKFPHGWGAVSLSASPYTVVAGASTTLTWSGPAGATYTLDYYTTASGNVHVPAPNQPALGNVGNYKSVALSADTPFYLTVIDSIDEQSYKAVQVFTVTVEGPTIVANGPSGDVDALTEVLITWMTTNAETVTLDPGGQSASAASGHGQFTVQPAENTTYVLTAVDAIGDRVQAEVAVGLNPPQILSFTASPPAARLGTAVTLQWRTRSAASALIDQGVGSVSVGDASQQVTPIDDGVTIYTLTVQSQGTATDSVNVISVGPGYHETAFGPGALQAAQALVFGSRLWAIDTWAARAWFSDDGLEWTPAGLFQRWLPFSVGGAAVFDPGTGPRMWLLGGTTDGGQSSNAVWCTTDATGLNWEGLQPAGSIWSPRSAFGCSSLLGKLWVFGGMDGAGNMLSDVWSSPDGMTWTQETNSPGWSARCTFATAVVGDQLWLVGGTSTKSMVPNNDVWSTSDGVHWTKLDVRESWTPRRDALVACVGSSLWLTGGVDASQAPPVDTWSIPIQSASQWTRFAQDAPWTDYESMPLSTAVFNGLIWFVGGSSLWYFLPS